MQHEFDHLNGVVFLDRMRDLRPSPSAPSGNEFMTVDEDGPRDAGSRWPERLDGGRAG